MCLPVRLGDAVWFLPGTVAEPNLLHDPLNRPLTGDTHILRLSEEQRLIHANPAISIVAFIFIMNCSHGVRQILLFPWALPVCQIFIESLPRHMQHPAVEGEPPLDPAVLSLSCDEHPSVVVY